MAKVKTKEKAKPEVETFVWIIVDLKPLILISKMCSFIFEHKCLIPP